ncbi:MAG TPA: hypothetical protein VKP88_02015, partial [Candidatus Paceibacterota bacterium]|nr:hypothetical protein [Candidatus Paceibacterota bacterium]
TTVPGATYYYQLDVDSTGGNGVSLKAGTSPGATNLLFQIPTTNTGRRYGMFVASTTTTYILVVNHNNGGVSVVDNISVKLADEDRSVNG